MKWLGFSFWTGILFVIEICHIYSEAKNVTKAKLNTTYTGNVGSGNEDIYSFDLTGQLKAEEVN